MKKTILILLILLIFPFVNAVTLNTFNDGTGDQQINLTWSAGMYKNTTKYITIPSTALVTNSYFYLTGTPEKSGEYKEFYYPKNTTLNQDKWTNLSTMSGAFTNTLTENNNNIYFETNSTQGGGIFYLSANKTGTVNNFTGITDLIINFESTISKGDCTNQDLANYISLGEGSSTGNKQLWQNVTQADYSNRVTNGTKRFFINPTTNFAYTYYDFNGTNSNVSVDISSLSDTRTNLRIFTSQTDEGAGCLKVARFKIYGIGIRYPTTQIKYNYTSSTYPANVNISGIYSGSNNLTTTIQINTTSYLNTAINSGSCSCSGCVLNASGCNIPIYVDSSNGGGINITGLSVTYTLSGATVLIKNQLNGSLINDRRCDLLLTTIYNATNYTTLTGSVSISNLTGGFLTFETNATNFSKSINSFTHDGNSLLNYTAYLLPIELENTVAFVVKDKGDDSLLENASINIQRVINSSWETVSILTTDVTGRATFFFQNSTSYKFNIYKNNFINKPFTLNPIAFSSYSVWLERDVDTENFTNYEGIYWDYEPKQAINNQNNQFNFSIFSLSGLLNQTGLTVSYGGYVNSSSSTDPKGERFTRGLPIYNATNGQTVTFIWYYVINGSYFSNTIHIPILINVTGNGTFSNIKNNDYCLGLIERTLIVTVIIMLVAGSVTFYMGKKPGIITIFFLISLFSYYGFINKYLGVISVILLFLVWIGSGD
jgi:hypothetical protein